MNETLVALKVGTGWIDIEVMSEPYVIMTFKGYAPVVTVKVVQSGIQKMLYISAKSLSEALEPLRVKNSNRFSGLKLRIRKESEDKMAPYNLEENS